MPDRAYVFAAAAQAMRDVIVDHARRHGAQKRGGGQAPLTMSALAEVSNGDDLDAIASRVLDIDTALRQLQAISPRAAQLVECRFFGGLSIDEAADALGISATTAKREWRCARAWLHRALDTDDGPASGRSAEGGSPPPEPHAD